jgi:peptidoglycan/LPS O-acetylase OafA/YrhL
MSVMEWRWDMVTLKSLMAVTLLLPASAAFGATENTPWPGPSFAALLGVVIVVFVLIRWKSKP